MRQVDDARKLGYTVAESSENEDGATVYAVVGFGVEAFVLDSDTEFWNSLLDADTHAERVRQEDETDAETAARVAAAIPPPATEDS